MSSPNRVVAMVLVVLAAAAVAAQAENPTTGGAVDADANYVTIAVIAHITGDADGDGSATVLYRQQGQPTWKQGHPLYRMDSTRYAGSIFGLVAATTYEVDVQLSDPDGVSNDPAPFLITTKSEAIPGQGTGRQIYVSPTGNDNGAGTEADPYKTIGKAHSVSVAGDYIHVLPGTYRESVTITRSGSSSAYITYKAEGAGVILDSSHPGFLDGTPDWTQYSGNVYKANFTGTTTLVAADGIRLYPHGSLSKLQSSTYGGFYQKKSTLYVSVPDNGGDPDNHVMNVATLPVAITLQADYVVIDGFEIRYYGTDSYQKGIYINPGSYNIIRNNTLHHCGQNIWVKGTSSANNLIANNTIYDAGITSLPWDDVKGSDLEEGSIMLQGGWGNVVRDNICHGQFNGIAPCVSDYLNDEAYNGELDIYDNTIYDIGDDCLEPEGACVNLVIFDNSMDHTHMGLSAAPVTVGPLYFFRNVIWYYAGQSNSSALKLGNNTDGRIYLYHNSYCTPAANQNAFQPCGPFYNIIHKNNATYGTNWAIGDWENGSGANSTLSWDYDVIYTTSSTHYVMWASVQYDTLAAFRSATGQEMNGIDADPLFTNMSTGDLTLQSGSPCIDHGVVIPGINDGYSGSAPDIGAYEYSGAPQPPVANFTGNPTSGTAPLTVNFTDSSTNSPTSWSWNFGDSGASSAQHPSHQYTSAGTYTVSLRATNAAGYDDESKTNYITVTAPQPPVANFSGNPTTGNAPLTVAFTDLSTGNPTSWSWSFGDGGNSGAQHPSHTYNNVGTYTVSLTATNAQGSDTETKPDYITVSDQSCHVGSIDLVGMYQGTGKPSGRGYYAEATITAHDQDCAVLSGVTVDITWSGCVSGTDSGVTNDSGQVVLTSPVNPDGGTFTCTVTNLTKSGYPYNSGANHETSDSIQNP